MLLQRRCHAPAPFVPRPPSLTCAVPTYTHRMGRLNRRKGKHGGNPGSRTSGTRGRASTAVTLSDGGAPTGPAAAPTGGAAGGAASGAASGAVSGRRSDG